MTDAEHKCHCSHVVVVVHDLKRAERLVWILIVAVVAALVHMAAGAMGSHVREAPPPSSSSERLFEDRATR